MRSLLVVIAVMLPRVAAADDHLAPNATQQAVLGCWNTGRGTTLVLSPFGKHSVKYAARFTSTPRGGPDHFEGDATWAEAQHDFEVWCRPRSEHGGFCRVAPEPNHPDALRVLVYAFPYNNHTQGRLVESFAAPRCAAATAARPAATPAP